MPPPTHITSSTDAGDGDAGDGDAGDGGVFAGRVFIPSIMAANRFGVRRIEKALPCGV